MGECFYHIGKRNSFFFLLRASEYVAADGGEYDVKKCLCVEDVMPRKNGSYDCTWEEADEIVLYLRGSKVDIYNLGEVRNLKECPGCPICPVRWMKELHRRFPSLRNHPERFLFQGPGGKTINREMIQSALRDGAIECGHSPRMVGSHSQRCGGATALHNAGYSLEFIKRFGRWRSDCVKIYLWDGHEMTDGVVNSMASADYELHISCLEHRHRMSRAAIRQEQAAARPPRH